MKSIVACAAAVLWLGASGAAPAQTIFRCGHEYSRIACPRGKAIEAESRTTAAQRTEARQVALREKRLATEMVRDRRLQEAALKPALAGSLGPAPPSPPASAPKHAKNKKKKGKAAASDEPRDFIAAVPTARKTR